MLGILLRNKELEIPPAGVEGYDIER